MNAITQMKLGLVFKVIFCCGCASRMAVEQLETRLVEQQNQISDLMKHVDSLDFDVKRTIMDLKCKNRDVQKFMQSCEEMLQKDTYGQCRVKDLTALIARMLDQEHVLLRFKLKESSSQVHPLRKAQIEKLINSRVTFSRLLMIVQAANEGIEETNDALTVARKLRNQLIKELEIPAALPFQGPIAIGCKNKRQILDAYSEQIPDDRPLQDEPSRSEAQITVWLFRIDCK